MATCTHKNIFDPKVLAFLKTRPEGYTPVTEDDLAIITALEGVTELPSTKENDALIETMHTIIEANLDLLYANGFTVADVM